LDPKKYGNPTYRGYNSFVCSPSPHSHGTVETMLNLFKLALRLEWPVITILDDVKFSVCRLNCNPRKLPARRRA
jgi:hypothetical protein